MNPPVGLKAIVLSPKTIIVTWSDSTLGRNQRITDNRYYTIRYKATTAKKQKFLNSTDHNMHIDDLKPNTEYEFSVKVIKGRRQSSWGMIAVNRTYESGDYFVPFQPKINREVYDFRHTYLLFDVLAPSSSPRDLTSTGVESKPTWVMLSWQPPRHINGHVTGA